MMSKCISSHGEYSEHEPSVVTFVCARCWVFDEDAALAEIGRLRTELAAADDYRDMVVAANRNLMRTNGALAAKLEQVRAWDRWRDARLFGDEGTPYSNGVRDAHRAICRLLDAAPEPESGE